MNIRVKICWMVFFRVSVWVNSMGYWIDSHCHMNDKEVYDQNFDTFMKRAKENNVGRHNFICLNKEDYLYSLEKQKQYSNIDISFGYFPEDAQNIKESDLLYLESVIDSLIAVGEIGLDYHWNQDFIAKQQELFIRQIELANKYRKPIEIHSRDAGEDTYNILKKYAKTRILMHCYSYDCEMMEKYLDLGCYISIAGTVTFKKAEMIQKDALMVPLDRLMIETDCPYLTPVPFRGKRNETAYVCYTGEYIAKLRNIETEVLQKQLMENYQNFFDIQLERDV